MDLCGEQLLGIEEGHGALDLIFNWAEFLRVPANAVHMECALRTLRYYGFDWNRLYLADCGAGTRAHCSPFAVLLVNADKGRIHTDHLRQFLAHFALTNIDVSLVCHTVGILAHQPVDPHHVSIGLSYTRFVARMHGFAEAGLHPLLWDTCYHHNGASNAMSHLCAQLTCHTSTSNETAADLAMARDLAWRSETAQFVTDLNPLVGDGTCTLFDAVASEPDSDMRTQLVEILRSWHTARRAFLYGARERELLQILVPQPLLPPLVRLVIAYDDETPPLSRL
jgi:putative intracellular protease/amidase